MKIVVHGKRIEDEDNSTQKRERQKRNVVLEKLPFERVRQGGEILMLVDTPEWPAELETEKHEVHRRDDSEQTYLFRRYFLVASVADHHVRRLSSESRVDTFEAILSSNFRCTVDILDVEHATEPVEEHFRQGWNQLAGRDQNVDTVLPISPRVE